jgi:hypothetical protein
MIRIPVWRLSRHTGILCDLQRAPLYIAQGLRFGSPDLEVPILGALDPHLIDGQVGFYCYWHKPRESQVTGERFNIVAAVITVYPFGPVGTVESSHCGEALCVPLHDPVQFDPPPPRAPPTTNPFQS